MNPFSRHALSAYYGPGTVRDPEESQVTLGAQVNKHILGIYM